MKKISLFAAFSFFFVLAAWAQTPTVSPELLIAPREDYRFVGKVHDTAIVLLYEEEQFRLALYDDKLQVKITPPIRPERGNIDILKDVTDKDFFTVIYRYNAQGKSATKALRLSAQGNVLDSTTLQTTLRWGISYDPSIVISEDRTKALIYELTEANTVFNAVLFDLRTFKPIWTRVFRPLGLDYNNSLKDVVIDNLGGVYWLIEHDNRKIKIANNRLDVIYYTAELSQEWAMSVPLSGRLWQDVFFNFDNKNRILTATGFYSTRKTSQSEGAFFFSLSPLQPLQPAVQFNEFDAAFIQQLTGKEQRNKQGFEDFKIQKVVPRADGGVLLIAEYMTKYVHTITNNMATRPGYGASPYDTRTTTEFQYHDLLLTAFQANGTIQWKEMLPKRQFSQDDDALYSSFYLMKTKYGLRFIYNDEIKSAGGNINEYIVAIDGAAQRRNLYNSEKANLQLILREARQTSANEVWIPSFRKDKMQLLRLNY